MTLKTRRRRVKTPPAPLNEAIQKFADAIVKCKQNNVKSLEFLEALEQENAWIQTLTTESQPPEAIEEIEKCNTENETVLLLIEKDSTQTEYIIDLFNSIGTKTEALTKLINSLKADLLLIETKVAQARLLIQQSRSVFGC